MLAFIFINNQILKIFHLKGIFYFSAPNPFPFLNFYEDPAIGDLCDFSIGLICPGFS